MALGVFYFVLYMLVVGMAVGWLAWLVLGKSKALTRDRKPNWGLLLVLGLAGSLIGGTLANLLGGGGFDLQFSMGLIASFLGALVAVAAYTAIKKK